MGVVGEMFCPLYNKKKILSLYYHIVEYEICNPTNNEWKK